MKKTNWTISDNALSWAIAVFAGSGLTAWTALVAITVSGLAESDDPIRSVPWLAAYTATLVYTMVATPSKATTIGVASLATIATLLAAWYAVEQFERLLRLL